MYWRQESIRLQTTEPTIRHKSDYDTFYIASKEDALEQIGVAKEIIELVKNYLVQKGMFLER